MTIDGKDIYKTYGCRLSEGSLDDYLKYPKRKSVNYNNWAEANGIEPDLSTVEFESKTIKISFAMESNSINDFWDKYKKIISDISAPGYRVFNLIPGLQKRLRFNAGNSCTASPFNTDYGITEFELSLIEDDISIPVLDPIYEGIALKGWFSINGIDFAKFGIASDDELDDILKYPAMKNPFTDGNTVDLSTIKTQHKEIKLSLWMIANNIEEFVNNYCSFFSQWNKTGTQSLYIKAIESTVQAYYTDCSAYSVEIWDDNHIAVRFTLSITIPVVSWINAGGSTIYRVLMDSDKLLADEDNKILVLN